MLVSIQRPSHSSWGRICLSVFHPHFWPQPGRLRNRLYSWPCVQASVGLLGWREAWGNLCRYERTSEVTDDGAWDRLRLAAEFGWTKGNSSSPGKIKTLQGKQSRNIALALPCFEDCSVSNTFPENWLVQKADVCKCVFPRCLVFRQKTQVYSREILISVDTEFRSRGKIGEDLLKPFWKSLR